MEIAFWRPAAPDGVGDLCRGRIVRQAPALAGAFVAIGAEVEGFLPERAGAKDLAEGAIVTVEVVRAAQGGKGPRLVRRGSGEGEGSSGGKIGLIRRGPNALVRLAGRWPNAPIAVDDAGTAAELARLLPGRIERGPGFDPMIEAEIEAAALPDVPLADGARLSIEATRAFVAIDVDAAAASDQRGGASEVHRRINRAAIPEIARQIRLRNLSGAILVDLAGQSVRARRRFAATFQEALSRDPLQPSLLGFTALGFAEILRPRLAPPLSELLAGPYAAGLRALRAALRAGLAEPSVAWRLRATPDILAALARDGAALGALTRRTGRELTLASDPTLAPMDWRLERAPVHP